MFCPECGGEYPVGLIECPECEVPLTDEADLDVLIRTGFKDPVAIGLVKSLFQEAGIPFFEMDQSVVPRQESGNFIGWWNVRVPGTKEAQAREILLSVEQMD